MTTEGANQAVTGTAVDNAGNTATDPATVSIDKTAPTIAAAANRAPNGAGWYNADATVTFTCGDALSGIATCPAPRVLGEGANQTVGGTAIDKAGNTASATVAGINIDRTPPTIALSGLNEVYILGEAIAPTCAATDGLSGVGPNGCTIAVSGGTASGVGTFTFTATATDNAGNTATRTGSYRVIYRFDGFQQPIDDPANPECGAACTPSVFKAGGMVPVRFELKRADGTVVQANSLPVWLTPVRGGPTTAAVGEGSYSDPATSGSTYQQRGQQYQYMWSTKGAAAGYFYRLGVTLDDGQTYYVTIALR